jgi:8-oxo-dGTP pyrophosphatase MutT (NUDIX family)
MAIPVIPLPAATVILIRDLGQALGVYLMRRSLKSSYMGGNFVFPGGKVDAADGDPAFWAASGDVSGAELARRLCDTATEMPLLAYAVAAVRETWEEAGVLLAIQTNGAGDRRERLLTLRRSKALSPDWLRLEIESGRLIINFSALWPWSHWIAPEAFKQRFDTRFFIAVMPPDQTCHPDPRETPEGRWTTPREALEANTRGELNLSPPTLVTLDALLAYPSVAALEADLPRPGWGPALMPKLVLPKPGPMLIQPWDPAYNAPEASLPKDTRDLQRLPVGAAFSRLWSDEGTWRPVA